MASSSEGLLQPPGGGDRTWLRERVGELVKQARKNAGMSQDKLGVLGGGAGESVRTTEAGRNLPSLDTLYRWAQVLGVPVTALLPNEQGDAMGWSVKRRSHLRVLPSPVESQG